MDIRKKIFEERVLSEGNKYYWSFYAKFTTYKEFISEFKEYNQEINDQNDVKDFIVFSGKSIIIKYQCGLFGDPLEYKVNAKLGATTISFLELMFEFNNGVYDYLESSDHHFFEGLEFFDLKNEILILSLRLGS